MTPCGWGVKTGMVRVCGWQIKLCVTPLLHISEHIRDKELIYKVLCEISCLLTEFNKYHNTR